MSQITSDTPTNLVIGAGEVYMNQDSLGASSGDNAFRIERTLFTPSINGAKGKLLGTDYVLESNGFLETGLAEISATAMAAAWPGSSSGTDTDQGRSGTKIDEDDTRRIPTTAYNDWELQVERLGGGEFQFEVDDAIQTGNIEMTFADNGMVVPKYMLASRWDPADLTASPHRIRITTLAS